MEKLKRSNFFVTKSCITHTFRLPSNADRKFLFPLHIMHVHWPFSVFSFILQQWAFQCPGWEVEWTVGYGWVCRHFGLRVCHQKFIAVNIKMCTLVANCVQISSMYELRWIGLLYVCSLGTFCLAVLVWNMERSNHTASHFHAFRWGFMQQYVIIFTRSLSSNYVDV